MAKYNVTLYMDVEEKHYGIEADSEEEAYEIAKDNDVNVTFTILDEHVEYERVDE